jgi:hypothetical protein
MEGLECGKNDKHEHLTRKLERFADRIAGVEAEKQHSINRYAAGALTKEAYIALNLSLDAEIRRLHKRKAQIAKQLDEAAANDLVQEKHPGVLPAHERAPGQMHHLRHDPAVAGRSH